MVLVSHDLGIVAQECDVVAVMYAGHIVEYGTADEVLASPRHPYTAALMQSTLPVKATGPRAALRSIPGQPPELVALPRGCPFQSRCPYAEARCQDASMQTDRPVPQHGSACIMPDRIAG
jgi:oligopeptide/dipeptide ABC transporter ATP-binding protein